MNCLDRTGANNVRCCALRFGSRTWYFLRVSLVALFAVEAGEGSLRRSLHARACSLCSPHFRCPLRGSSLILQPVPATRVQYLDSGSVQGAYRHAGPKSQVQRSVICSLQSVPTSIVVGVLAANRRARFVSWGLEVGTLDPNHDGPSLGALRSTTWNSALRPPPTPTTLASHAGIRFAAEATQLEDQRRFPPVFDPYLRTQTISQHISHQCGGSLTARRQAAAPYIPSLFCSNIGFSPWSCPGIKDRFQIHQ